MKIVLSKNDVMRLICKECNVETTELIGGDVLPEKDNIYWEGNLEMRKNKEGKIIKTRKEIEEMLKSYKSYLEDSKRNVKKVDETMVYN